LHVKQPILWPIPVYEKARVDTAVQVQLMIIDLINLLDPGPGPARFNIQAPAMLARVSSGRYLLESLQYFAEEYGRRAGVQLWFDVESGRNI
jgi:hypothetical protein